MAEQIEPDPGRDILQAISNLGGTIDAVEEITRLRAPGNRHACFKLELQDGRTVKARRFKSVGKHESVTVLYPALKGLPFSRLLAVHGAATIGEWVPGAPVEPGDVSHELTRSLVTILGNLHCRKAPCEFASANTRSVDGYSVRLRDQLAVLVSNGHIKSHDATTLIDLAVKSQPPNSAKGIIHTDFHPRNMTMKQNDEVWMIDNEGIRLGALDYDIARCWRQWPMTREQRDIFCEAYSSFRSLDLFLPHQEFWSICTLVQSARIHARFRQPSQGVLEKLNRIAQNVGEALWPERSIIDRGGARYQKR